MIKNKQLYLCILSLLILIQPTLKAQQLRITHLDSDVELNFDLSRFYNYNYYERNRWGAGLTLNVPIQHNEQYGRLQQNSVQAEAYAGWGTGDHAWKYGGQVALVFPRNSFRRLYVGYCDDIERAGMHSFSSYNLLSVTQNSSYFTSHYSAIQRLYGGFEWDPLGPITLAAQLRYSSERLLFDADTLLYPVLNSKDALPCIRFLEGGLRLRWGNHLTLGALLGRPLQSDADAYGVRPYGRVVAQYARTFDLGQGKGGLLRLFVQTGTTLSDDTPLSRRFDLSGTGGSRFFFDNTLVTIMPNTFMADGYAQLTVRYQAPRPLWRTLVSNPLPFVQLSALWGTLYGSPHSDGYGYYDLLSGRPLTMQEAAGYSASRFLMPLFAPNQGVLEPGFGFDRLLQQDYLSMGVAVAYQLSPKKAFYYSDNFWDKFAVMLTVRVELEP